jgi:glycosyltransferase involved in cell wall biosynthesis
MRILFLTNELPYSTVAGGHRLVYLRIKMLLELGQEVGLASLLAPGQEAHVPEMKDMLFELETAPVRERHVLVRAFHDYISFYQPAIFWKNYSAELMRKIGDMVERNKYDVVIAEYSEMGMYLYRNPYLSAVRKVVSCHRCLSTSFANYIQGKDLPASLRLKSASQLHKLERYEFEMYSAMDHILTLTPEDRFTLLNYAPELPVSVILPGIDFDFFDREAPPKPKEPIVTMCGFFSNKSNNDAALWFIHEAWPLIRSKHPDLQLHFVGLGMQRELKQAAKNDARILLFGEVDDLRPHRERAQIFINPMRIGSGLRIKVLEAMATGLPVVSTALGVAGIPVKNGVDCFIADTPQLMADSIGWLLHDQTLRESMGHAAKKMVRERYHVRSTACKLEKLLQEVLSV